jgi:putative hydrolase
VSTAGPVSPAEDYHVHSLFSDGTSTLEQNVAVARQRGLGRLCLVDHVRRDTAWVPDFVRAVQSLREPGGMGILAGVEAEILDRTGQLDLPDAVALAGIDLILIADHQFPADAGPALPQHIRADLADELLSPREAIEGLVEATANALKAMAATAGALGLAARPVLAHLFSILPKIGLTEPDVPDALLGLLAGQARAAGAMVEVNEKWSCPSARTLRAFASAGVPLVASTDSHDCKDIGVYRSVTRTLDAAFGRAA